VFVETIVYVCLVLVKFLICRFSLKVLPLDDDLIVMKSSMLLMLNILNVDC